MSHFLQYRCIYLRKGDYLLNKFLYSAFFCFFVTLKVFSFYHEKNVAVLYSRIVRADEERPLDEPH